jgi:ADP-dependent NAD(P)H-hydrate dehydratase / NAD(P)H-hydrate epimerase
MEITPEMLRPLIPARSRDSHKGTFGHVLILAGSRGFTGAARLAAEGAYRSGAGLVTVGIPEPLAAVAAAMLIEAMSLALPATRSESFSPAAVGPALDAAQTRQAVVLGPGISQHEDTRRFVAEFVEQCPVPLLIDADGLNCLSHDLSPLARAGAPVILTPHPGEMARLCGCSTDEVQSARAEKASEFARSHNCVVILKGSRTVVASNGETCYTNPTGNAGLATGGTGDVLSGLVGGLLAQGLSCDKAARLGVYLHGLAGDFAARELTQQAMLARDVLAALPQAWHALIEGNDSGC